MKDKRTSRLAVTSFVIALLPLAGVAVFFLCLLLAEAVGLPSTAESIIMPIIFVFVFLAPPVGLITAICGLAVLGRNSTKLKGQGFATGALVISIAGFFVTYLAMNFGGFD